MAKAKVKKDVKDEKVLNIKIPKKLHRSLRMRAADLDVNMRDIVIKALMEHLNLQAED